MTPEDQMMLYIEKYGAIVKRDALRDAAAKIRADIEPSSCGCHGICSDYWADGRQRYVADLIDPDVPK